MNDAGYFERFELNISPENIYEIKGVEAAVLIKGFKEKYSNSKNQFKTDKEFVLHHFKEIRTLVHSVHHELTLKKSPYRFCAYQKDDEVLMDVVILSNDHKKVKYIKSTNISMHEFFKISEDILSGKGLFIEEEG